MKKNRKTVCDSKNILDVHCEGEKKTFYDNILLQEAKIRKLVEIAVQ